MVYIPNIVQIERVFRVNWVKGLGVSYQPVAKRTQLIEFTVLQVDGLGGPLSAVVVRAEGVLSSDSSKPLIASLEKDGQVSIDIILTASRPLRGTIAIVFRTVDGTTARMRLGLQLNIRRPVLMSSPSSIRDDIARGTQKSFQVLECHFFFMLQC
jgi:hypothetical protein